MSLLQYTTPHGILVSRTSSAVGFTDGLHELLRRLDSQRGVYLSSGYEYPERYSRWDIGSVAPPVEIVGQAGTLSFRALNERGKVFLVLLQAAIPLLDLANSAGRIRHSARRSPRAGGGFWV